MGLMGVMGAGFLAACSGGDEKPKPSNTTDDLSKLKSLPGPQRMREQAQHLEPTEYVKTYQVDPSGKGGAFKTIKDCYAAIAKDKSERLGVGAASPQSNPWDWRRVQIAPGTYTESLSGTPPHVALIGMGKTPEETRFVTDTDVDTIGTTGRSTYLRNLYLEQKSNNPDSHPLREQGQSGDAGLGPWQRRTLVFEDVKFVAGGNGPWGKTAADIMPGPGTFLVFNRCTFDAPGQQQTVNVVTSSHPTPAASNYAFIGCTVGGNQKRAGNSDSTMSYPFGAPDFSSGFKDTFLWMDGKWALGSAVRVDALLAFPNTLDSTNGKVTKKNPSTTYVVINPGTSPGAKATAPDGVKPPTDQVPSSFQLPLRCLSDQERAFFGSKPGTGLTTITPTNPQSGTMTLKKGQVYWVAMDMQGQAICSQGVRFDSDVSGSYSVALTLSKQDEARPDMNGNLMVAGKSSDAQASLDRHWYYPGQGKLWVAIAAPEDITVPAMKAKAGEAFSASGFDGSQIPDAKSATVVAAGTLVPRPSVLSALPDTMK